MKEKKDLSIENEENSIYEVGYHITTIIGEKEVVEVATEIKKIIEKEGGKIISEEAPELVNLAYGVSKNIGSKHQSFTKAYFGWVKFELASSSVIEVKNIIEKREDILRLILIKTVRENTIYYPKAPRSKREDVSDEVVDLPQNKEISEEDIDKSIEELVIV